jgi:hypothetical protein
MKDRTKIRVKEILFSDVSLVGYFWNHCKADNRCEKSPYDTLLKNEILGNDYAKYTENILKNKGVTRLTQEEKVDELLKIMKDRTEIIRRNVNYKKILFSDKSPMCTCWDNCIF